MSNMIANGSKDPDSLLPTEGWDGKQALADPRGIPEVEAAIVDVRPLIAGSGSPIETEPTGG